MKKRTIAAILVVAACVLSVVVLAWILIARDAKIRALTWELGNRVGRLDTLEVTKEGKTITRLVSDPVLEAQLRAYRQKLDSLNEWNYWLSWKKDSLEKRVGRIQDSLVAARLRASWLVSDLIVNFTTGSIELLGFKAPDSITGGTKSVAGGGGFRIWGDPERLNIEKRPRFLGQSWGAFAGLEAVSDVQAKDPAIAGQAGILFESRWLEGRVGWSQGLKGPAPSGILARIVWKAVIP